MAHSRPTVGRVERARLRLRPGFLLTFTAAGAVAVAALAWALGWMASEDARSDHLQASRQSGTVIARSSYQPLLGQRLASLDKRTLRALDETTTAAQQAGALHDVVVWTRKGRVAYAQDHGRIGTTASLTNVLAAALDGETVTRELPAIATGPRARGRRIEVTVPLYRGAGAKPVAAVQMSLPYEPLAASVRQQSLRMQLILIAFALLFYAAILPRLIAASRAAREKHDPDAAILARELAAALEAGELELHYQPIVELGSGRVTSMESFLRWNHPRRGALPPTEFLPVAVRGNLIGPITLYILDRALRDCRAWREAGTDAGVNVNLSEANVLDERLPGEVGRLLGQYRIPPSALCLEVTEQAISADPQHAGAVLRGLDEMGVRISIDDFGTGYSSLAGLRDLPVSELKVDHQFVRGLTSTDRDAAITQSIIGLAHDLEVRVIAEGVEDLPTLERLAELRCDGAQGFFFSPALALPEMLAWLTAPTLHAQAA